MSVEVPAGAGQRPDSVPIAESEGWSAPGVRVLVTGIVLLLAGIVLLVLGVSLGPNAAGPDRADLRRRRCCSSRAIWRCAG